MKFFTSLKSASQNRLHFTTKASLFLFIFLPSYFFSHAQIPGMAKLSVLLLLNQNGGSHNTADGAVAVFAPGFSASVGNEDSYKFTNLDENLALNCGGTLLSIEGRPAITSTDTLPLTMWQFRQNTYCLQLDGSNFAPNLTATIIDKYLGQETSIDLAGSTIVTFGITADSASFVRNRFTIVFKTSGVLPVTIADINAIRKDKGVQVNWTIKSQSEMGSYQVEKSVNGQQFETAATVAIKGSSNVTENYSWYDANVSSGNNYYRVKAIEKTGNVKYSSVARVTVGNDNNALTVFPNPVVGNTIGLQLSSLEKGNYTVVLYNTQGQKVFAKSINHAGGSANLAIQVDKQLRSGNYTLQLTNNIIAINKSLIVR